MSCREPARRRWASVAIARKVSPDPSTVDKQAAFLKVHMRDGDVYVLRRWDLHVTRRAACASPCRAD